MSDNSFKSKARRQQKATGTSYMRARREVDNNSKPSPAGGIPMTADAAKMLSLMGLDHSEASDFSRLWAERALPVGTNEPVDTGDLLRVPLGLRAGGAPVWLDLKASRLEADGRQVEGHGPHGLLAGCTGSGKSTALRTMLFGLCAQHSPDLLQAVLINTLLDDANSADQDAHTFSAFADYPHIAAVAGRNDFGEVLRKLMDDRERALSAANTLALDYCGQWSVVDDGAVAWATAFDEAVELESEVRADLEQQSEATERAKVYYQPAGSIGRYNQVRSTPAGADLPPVPYTVVLVDGKQAVMGARFDEVIRRASTLGIHVVVACQDPQEVVSSYGAELNYRIAFRAFHEAVSRAAIGRVDACHLPEVPGVGLFRARPRNAVVTHRGFLLRDDWIGEVGRQMAAAS